MNPFSFGSKITYCTSCFTLKPSNFGFKVTDSIWIDAVENPSVQLSCSWSRICYGCVHAKFVASSLIWSVLQYIHWSQKFEVPIQQEWAKFCQCIWLKYMSDYDIKIRYHPKKDNVVVDTLSPKDSIVIFITDTSLSKSSSTWLSQLDSRAAWNLLW